MRCPRRTFSCCLFSFGTKFCWKYSASTGGKHWSVCVDQLWGVFWLIMFKIPLNHELPAPMPSEPKQKHYKSIQATPTAHSYQLPHQINFILPEIWIALAIVSTSARLSSSDSCETICWASETSLDSWVWTSTLLKPVINRKAVISTLE